MAKPPSKIVTSPFGVFPFVKKYATIHYTFKNVKVVYGDSDSKIHAINRDIELADEWDIVLLASDDMTPKVKGYDNIIRNKMKEFYPDTDGILWFNDGHQTNRLNTLCILGKKYYEKVGLLDLFEKKGIIKQQGNRLKYVDPKGVEIIEFRKNWTGDKLTKVMNDFANIENKPEEPKDAQ